MNILLVAEGSTGNQALQGLGSSPHRVVAVMTSPPNADGHSGMLWNQARKLGHDTWPAQLVKDPAFAEQIRTERVDLLLNVFSLYIIHSEVLEAPRLGSFNLHPGPLPRYAGLNSMCWAIYNGEKKHGVTLHRMAPKVDTGPIVYQQEIEIQDEDTGLSLAVKCIKAGVPLIERLLHLAATSPEAIPAIPQDLSQRSYFGAGVPQNGNILWDRPARAIFNFVRACDFAPFRSPWGQVRATCRGEGLYVTKVSLTGKVTRSGPGTVGEVTSHGAEVACADEWLLVRRVSIAGKSWEAAKVVKPGDRLEDGATSV